MSHTSTSKRRPFFLWSEEGATVFLAKRLQDEGHPVLLYIQKAHAQEVGRGIVPKTADDKKIPKGAIVLFDTAGHGTIGERYRKQGHLVIGGNPYDTPLEVDRPAGSKIMQKAGIAVPETRGFKTASEAIAFLQKKREDDTWFIKLSGNANEAMTSSSSDPDLMIRYLTWLDESGEPFTGIELQKEVKGTEVSVEGWFDGDKFVPPFDLTVEEKKFQTGDLGPRTGCESSVIWPAENTRLFDQTVARIEENLRAEGYIGPIDLNCIVDPQGVPHGLEWTARFGFDETASFLRWLGTTTGEQLEAFARKMLPKWEFTGQTFQASLRVTVPPYPTYSNKDAAIKSGFPLDPKVLDAPFDIDDVMLGPDDLPALAGRDGTIGSIHYEGDEINALRGQLLMFAKSLDIPSLQYRLDPVHRFEAAWSALKGHGYVGSQEGLVSDRA